MITVVSFALTLLVAGIFEQAGLAMIIGAYIMGLTLSKTDISYIIQERLEMLQKFFVPMFFCVMGMLINVERVFAPDMILFGFIFVIFAILSKVIGCGLPALFLNFNLRCAITIGTGMVPRGEVALIIAGIGLASGIINDEIFSIALLMTFVTTLLTPPILDKMLNSTKRSGLLVIRGHFGKSLFYFFKGGPGLLRGERQVREIRKERVFTVLSMSLH